LSSEPLFAPSTITADGAATHRDTIVRNSSVALVPRTEPVRCLERRALAVQGWRDDVWIERLRTQRYRGAARQHYSHHYDWGSGARGWGRVSTLMAWVAADDEDETAAPDDDDNDDAAGPFRGGGTEFPLLPRRRGVGDRWCRWIECPELDGGEPAQASMGLDPELPLGVTFKPIRGNAVYWENFKPDLTGRGWEETWHAGLPVEKGTKVGLNIWSWGRLE
jgi:prolyl 4-hydroxylase